MKVAVAVDGKNVSAHFGHCEGFNIYSYEGDKLTEKSFLPNPGHRPGFLPVFLKENGINIIIAGGMGESAQQLFYNQGIEVYVGIQGDCDAAADNWHKGVLKSSGAVCHEHKNEETCNS